MEQEFSFLNKKDYIVNNLKNDFMFFIKQFQFVKLIKGIIGFIEINYKVNGKKETNCFNNLRVMYKSIIDDKINEENINEFINILKSDEYYFNSEYMLIKFYQTLLSNKESLAFLEKIKDSIINQKEDKLFNYSNEIVGLIDIYIFFENIIKNKEIKSAKDFINIYNKQIENNKNLKINLNKLINKYYSFLNKNDYLNNDLNEENEKKIAIKNNKVDLNSIIINFDYDGEQIIIQGNLNEKMSDIIKRFITKTKAKKNSIFFLYAGNTINEESILSDIVRKEDRNRNQMNILVNSISDNPNIVTNSIIKSKEIICPKCLEEINMKINNYSISLYECKNDHKFNDINFKDFTNSQNIDLKNIICNICNQKNKYNSYNNQFYKCFTCDKNLCPLCKSQHDKTHNINDWEKRNSICKLHFESYISYCKSCKKNLCMKCEKEHSQHKKVYYGDILPDNNEIKFRKDELGKYIYELNENINSIIKRLNQYKESINDFYTIYNDIINNVENKNRNYEILNNIIEINNNIIIKDIKNIIEEKDEKNKFNLILDISNKIGKKNNDEITLIYKINKNDKKIKIFDETFVNNNKDICKIIYNNQEIELKEYFDTEPNNEKLEIKLKGINKVSNASKIFNDCLNLESILDIVKWDLSNVTERNEMFKGCNKNLIIPKEFLSK